MPTKDDIANQLARSHFDIEPGISRIFRLRDANREESPGIPIKLLEINSGTAPVGVMPLQFGPSPAYGVPFSSVIVEVTPREFEQIHTAELSLPEGWSIAEELTRAPQLQGVG